MKKRTKLIITSLCAAVVVVSAIIAIPVLTADRLPSDVLSAEKIKALRTEYPVYTENPPMLEMGETHLSWSIWSSNTILMARSTGKRVEFTDSYTMDSDSNEAKIAEKTGGGIVHSVERYGYEVEVIKDSAGFFKKGEFIVIANNLSFEPVTPALKEGMQFIVPVLTNQHSYKEAKGSFWRNGFYYVTDDGYALSAFKETDYQLTGLKAEDVYGKMEELTKAIYGKTMDEMSKWVASQTNSK